MSTEIPSIARPDIARPGSRPLESTLPEPWQLGDEGPDSTEIERRVARQWNRIIRWAMKKPKAYLAHYIAKLVFKRQAERRKLRKARRGRIEIFDLAERILRAHKAAVAHHKQGPSRGGSIKEARNPLRPAKDDANRLWAKASAYGWTAERFTKALREMGHDQLKEGTVARWMTRLRKGDRL